MIKSLPSNLRIEEPASLKDFPILISGCLIGVCCRYDGGESGSSGIIKFSSSTNFIPFCPEQLGGLPTPRPPADIKGGDGRDVLSGKARVINAKGEDVTIAFRKGAEESLRLARLFGVRIALLKDKSPSCGMSTVYCEGSTESGMGVTAALFESSGIKMMEIDEEDFSIPDLTMLIEEAYGRRLVQDSLSSSDP